MTDHNTPTPKGISENQQYKKPHLILGVDPGLSGAFALVDPDLDSTSPRPSIVKVWDMPVHKIRGKAQLDLYALAAIVDAHASQIRAAIIEDVGARPGQGVTSMFRFGWASGAAAGIVSANLIPTFYVRPAVWKGAMGLSPDKDASIQMVTRLFPRDASLFARKKDDGRAEAVLLALFGRRNIEMQVTQIEGEKK